MGYNLAHFNLHIDLSWSVPLNAYTKGVQCAILLANFVFKNVYWY